MLVQVEVTQELIDRARQILGGSYQNRAKVCPIALAIKQYTVSACEVVVCHIVIFWDTTSKITIPMPDKPKSWMVEFDVGRDVQPFSFPLDIPDQYLVGVQSG